MAAAFELDFGAESFAAQVADRLREIDDLVAAVGARYEVILIMAPAMSERLGYFIEGRPGAQPARDVLQLNAHLQDVMTDAVSQRFALDPRPLNYLIALTVAGQAARGVFVERLATSGGDVRLDALAASTVAGKRRRGQDPRIGRASGDMAKAVATAQVVVRRASI